MQDDEIDYDDYDDFGDIDLELDWDSIGSKEGLVLENFHRTFLKLAIQPEFTKVRTVGVRSVRHILKFLAKQSEQRTLTSRCSVDPALIQGVSLTR